MHEIGMRRTHAPGKGSNFSLEPIVSCDTFCRGMNGFIKERCRVMRMEAKIITIGELCEYLCVHRSTLYRLLRSYQLPCFKIGSDWRFNVDEIDRWRVQQGAALNHISQDEAKNVH